jgi:hypothetical protein
MRQLQINLTIISSLFAVSVHLTGKDGSLGFTPANWTRGSQT